jgi:hypothetical protein
VANRMRAPRIRPFIFWSTNKVISQSRGGSLSKRAQAHIGKGVHVQQKGGFKEKGIDYEKGRVKSVLDAAQ